MVIGASFQQSPGSVRRRPGSRRIFGIRPGFPCGRFRLRRRSEAQQSPRRGRKAPSPFLEAETLLRQGSITEAKVKIEEQLKLNPSSVEGYNLLGIACTDEKDYAGAGDAFQHALKLAPNSTRHIPTSAIYMLPNKDLTLPKKNCTKADAWSLQIAMQTTTWLCF